MKTEIECGKCETLCFIDGDYPKFFAYCDTCRDYAEGFDATEYATDYISSKIDEVHDRMKDDISGEE